MRRGELEPHAVLVADGLGAARVAGEVLGHLLEDLGPLLHHSVGDLEDSVEMVGVLHQVDEAPQRSRKGEAFSDRLHHVPPCCRRICER